MYASGGVKRRDAKERSQARSSGSAATTTKEGISWDSETDGHVGEAAAASSAECNWRQPTGDQQGLSWAGNRSWDDERCDWP